MLIFRGTGWLLLRASFGLLDKVGWGACLLVQKSLDDLGVTGTLVTGVMPPLFLWSWVDFRIGFVILGRGGKVILGFGVLWSHWDFRCGGSESPESLNGAELYGREGRFEYDDGDSGWRWWMADGRCDYNCTMSICSALVMALFTT